MANGDLVSKVSAGSYFGLAGGGGYPGVPAYGGGTNLTPSNVSVTAQMANTTAVGAKVYSYSYFANLIPATTVINTVPANTFDQSAVNSGTIDPETGYYWYKYDGLLHSNLALTTSALNMGSRKVILMVDNAGMDIAGNINLTKGQGFLMAIVKGNIVVDPGVGGGNMQTDLGGAARSWRQNLLLFQDCPHHKLIDSTKPILVFLVPAHEIEFVAAMLAGPLDLVSE